MNIRGYNHISSHLSDTPTLNWAFGAWRGGGSAGGGFKKSYVFFLADFRIRAVSVMVGYKSVSHEGAQMFAWTWH